MIAAATACSGERPTFADGPDATLPAVTTTAAPRPGTVAVEDWATGFCKSFRDWQDETAAAGDELSRRVADTSNPKEVRSSLVTLLEQISTETATLAEGIRNGTVPDIGGGGGLVTAMAERFDDLAETFRGYAADARNIDVDDPDRFQEQVDAVVRSMTAGQGEIAGSFEKIDTDFPDPRFQRALRRSCAVG